MLNLQISRDNISKTRYLTTRFRYEKYMENLKESVCYEHEYLWCTVLLGR